MKEQVIFLQVGGGVGQLRTGSKGMIEMSRYLRWQLETIGDCLDLIQKWKSGTGGVSTSSRAPLSDPLLGADSLRR